MNGVGKGAAALAIAASLTIFPATFSPASSADLLAAARQYVGQTERGSRKALKRLIGVDPRVTRWCGAFLSAMARKAGYKPPAGHNLARSWSSFGKPVKLKSARKGDVIVLRGHVTIFTRFAGGKVCGIGGNQSNAVQESCYSLRRVVSVRRPRRRKAVKIAKGA